MCLSNRDALFASLHWCLCVVSPYITLVWAAWCSYWPSLVCCIACCPARVSLRGFAVRCVVCGVLVCWCAVCCVRCVVYGVVCAVWCVRCDMCCARCVVCGVRRCSTGGGYSYRLCKSDEALTASSGLTASQFVALSCARPCGPPFRVYELWTCAWNTTHRHCARILPAAATWWGVCLPMLLCTVVI